jgi:hypothetical protein
MLRVLLPLGPLLNGAGALAVFLLAVVATAVVALALFNKGRKQ